MSIITNLATGTVVTSSLYNASFTDALQRMTIDKSMLPCIRYGLQVTAGSGLTVNVTAGSAKGFDVNFTQINQTITPPITLSLPTDILMPAISGIVIPANTTGYIVLNVNIHPGPTTASNTYITQADDNGGTPVITPVFVSSLTPGPGSSYPYSQIALAYVVSGASTITFIDQSVSLNNRSFDWAPFLAGNSSTGGWAPGDLKQGYGPQSSSFWIPMDDTSIGSTTSGASHASNSFLAAYSALWNGVSNTYCPVVGGRGGSALADFIANKAMVLPASVGRALCNSGTAVLNQVFTANTVGSLITPAGPVPGIFYNGTPVTVSNSGGALPLPLVAATTYYVMTLTGTTFQLALTLADANEGTFITLTTNGTGTNTITIDYPAYVSGQIAGEPLTQLLIANLARHTHDHQSANGGNNASNEFIVQTSTPTDVNDMVQNPTGGDTPHNNIQPSSFAPVWLRVA